MLIWSGRGWLVAVLGFAAFLSAELLTEAVSRDASYYQRHGWPKLAAFLLVAALVFLLDRLGHFRDRKGTFVEKATGEEVELGIRHTLFFIPVRYWPLLLAALGVVFTFVHD